MEKQRPVSPVFKTLQSIPAPVILLIFARLIFLMVSTLQEIYGFGDVLHFFHMAQFNGLPFIAYWDEHPPLHAFLSKGLFFLAGGRENVYVNLLYLFFMGVDAGSLVLFRRLLRRCAGAPASETLTWFFTILLIALPYYWWYFDGMGVFWLLLSLEAMFSRKDGLSGFALALSTLTKLFPILFLAVVWRTLPWRRAAVISVISLGIPLAVYGGLYAVSPQFTAASVASQFNKGSWESIGALVDGNYQTGNFATEIDHFYPERAYELKRNPPVVNPLITLVLFAGVGLWAWIKGNLKTAAQVVSFLGFALCLLFIWSPGWSPQYVLFLIPLILLSLPERDGLLLAALLVLVNLLEWPVLLSRGYNWTLLATVPIRTLLLGLAVILWGQQVLNKKAGQVESSRLNE